MSPSDAAKAVVRRNTEEVQSCGNFEVFEELFADDFVDHTPQPNSKADKDGVRDLYHRLRAAFPDFYADIHWQAADGELVTTIKRIMERTRECFSVWRQRVEKFTSKLLMSCECATARSLIIGV